MLGVTSESRRLSARLIDSGTFDGNFTDCSTNWIFAEDDFSEITERGLAILTELTWQGNIAWVVFVPFGYRL